MDAGGFERPCILCACGILVVRWRGVEKELGMQALIM